MAKFKSKIGIGVFKYGTQWMVTLDNLPEDRENFHTVERKVKRNIPKEQREGIEFDSEYSQFVAYAPNKDSAVALATKMEKIL